MIGIKNIITYKLPCYHKCSCQYGNFEVKYYITSLFNKWNHEKIVGLKRTCKFECEDGKECKLLYEKYGRKF